MACPPSVSFLVPRVPLVELPFGTKTAAPAAALDSPLANALAFAGVGVGLDIRPKPEPAEPTFLIPGWGEVAVLDALVVMDPSGRMMGMAAEERGALGAVVGRGTGDERAAGVKLLL